MLKSSEIWIFKKILNPKVACKICELQATFCAHMLSVWLTQCWWDLDQRIASQSWITIPWSLGSKTTLNHKKRDITLGRVSVLSLYSTLQFILPRQFCRRKVQKKMYMRLERNNVIYMQEHPEKKKSQSNPNWSDSLNFLAFRPTLCKLFNDTLIYDEQDWEWYGLLLTPQCDKLCHLLTGKGHTWMILCFHPVFLSTLCISSFVAETKKKYVEDFSGAFLMRLSVV